jgi:hypothetical protein
VSEPKPLFLTKSTWIPAGAVLVLLSVAVRLTWSLNNTANSMDIRLSNIEHDMRRSWTAQDQKVWSQTLQIRNPALQVPDSDLVVQARQQNQ